MANILANSLAKMTTDNAMRWWPLVLLVVAGGLRWLVSGMRPESESSLLSGTVGCAWAALFTLALLRRAPARATLRRSWRGMLAGAMALGGPAIALLAGGPALDAAALTMALTLTAVSVAVAAAALGLASSDSVAGKIWPGLAAIGGLLLVLAEPSVTDLRADALLLLAPAVTGLGAALFCTDRTPGPWQLTTALAGASLLFAISLAMQHILGIQHILGTARAPVSLLAMAADGVMALLSMAVLARLGATRWAAQFVLIPLLVLMEGFAMMRPLITTRWIVGPALLVVASIYLLLPEDREETVVGS